MILRAVNIPPKIKFKEIVALFHYEKRIQNGYEVVFKLRKGAFIILYSFGVYVEVNIEPNESLAFKNTLKTAITELERDLSEEIYELEIKANSIIKVEPNRVILPEFNLDNIRIISLILAESVALDHFETQTEIILEKSLDYSKGLQSKGVFPRNHKDLLRFIGFATTTRQKILSNLFIYDSPDQTWNNPTLEKLFMKLKDMFDIEQRFKSLSLTLESIQKNIEIMVDLLNTRRATIMELSIIGLIAFEIIMSIIQIFYKG